MRCVFSGDLSDEAYRPSGRSVIELAKWEAVTQESLGRSPTNWAPHESLALKARLNPAGKRQLVSCFSRVLSPEEGPVGFYQMKNAVSFSGDLSDEAYGHSGLVGD
jgi:hypothetical protein